MSNAPEKLPEKKRPERGERDRSRGHGSGGTNPGSHGSSRQVSYETFTLLYLSFVLHVQNLVKQGCVIVVGSFRNKGLLVILYILKVWLKLSSYFSVVSIVSGSCTF